MIRSLVIIKYLTKEFLKVVFNMTFIFICLGFIINLFEEINFFKDYEVGIEVPITMSVLFVPNLIYNIFPFIILLSGIWFFLKIKKTDEIIALKISGISNLSIINVPSLLSVILGIFLVTSISPITSVLIKKYESVKSSYEKEKESLASVTVNGIWIKEKTPEKNYIIKSSKYDNFYLLNVSIYEFDNDYNFIRRIEAKKVNISTSTWKLDDAVITDGHGKKLINDNTSIFYYKSLYDIKKIKSLYSNLDTISFWNIKKEIRLLEERGYSTKEMEAKMQRSFAFPFFLLSMVLLGGFFTLGTNFKESNWTYIFIAIITSVIIFYFNDFSAALSKTDKLSVEVSVWMPIVIIFIFSAVGMIHANQK